MFSSPRQHLKCRKSPPVFFLSLSPFSTTTLNSFYFKTFTVNQKNVVIFFFYLEKRNFLLVGWLSFHCRYKNKNVKFSFSSSSSSSRFFLFFYIFLLFLMMACGTGSGLREAVSGKRRRWRRRPSFDILSPGRKVDSERGEKKKMKKIIIDLLFLLVLLLLPFFCLIFLNGRVIIW